ncbi:solute carrier family 12 member 3-like [Megalobrama amblycephala]|uniref:solute carrier family 12 member 3-like n=1 Tax=Megalobrama amblycephala TaxID=75352 RepID=UPI002013FE82|nr:solute carrier family 12 member 3-like [Megalobrama amblycephala]
MVKFIDSIRNLIPGLRRPDNNVPPQGVTVDMGEVDYGKEQDKTKMSFYNPLDPVPKYEFYAKDTFSGRIKNSRPSLDILRKPPEPDDLPPPPEDDERPKVKLVRFGWVLGVMIRCMLNIWGVIMYLRLPWITSQAGLILTYVIIFMSVTVTTITATSVSAISTNGKVKSGGTYFMISRSLGPELGAPIGLLFAFANALACALHTVGFAETVRDLLKDYKSQMVDDVNDVRIIGAVTVAILLCITFAGMSWEAKAQILFFIAIMLSLINYFVGTVIPPTPEKQAAGFFGYRAEIFVDNLLPSFRGKDGYFFRMFAIFFPAATGILSGVNICGDLKDPTGGIPKGTLLAILWTTLSYLLISVTCAATVVRDASGNLNDSLALSNFTTHCTGLGCKFGYNFDRCEQNRTCSSGLANNFRILTTVSGSGILITIGVFAATLSSALGFLVSAPKVFQCLCKDNIYPFIGFFAKGYGKNNEPLRGYCLTFIIAMAFILIGDLNTIAPLISNFFLCSYGLINFSCFHASVTKSPGWRPEYRFYSPWTSLFAAFLSVALMFLFTWWAALVTTILVFFLLGYVSYTKPQINWGSSYQASFYNMALSFSMSLTGVNDHVKNFRPQCLVLTGPPNARPALVDFVGTFTKNISLMICGNIIMEDEKSSFPQHSTDMLVDWLNQRKVRSFYTSFNSDCLKDGAHNLMQASGLGKLKPNTLVMGYKTNWQECEPESLQDYVNTISDAFDCSYGLAIMRMMDGLDVTDALQSSAGRLSAIENPAFDADEVPQSEKDETDRNSDISDDGTNDQVRSVFQTKQGRKTIDIYWISDDGGLTLLVPYLLTRRNRWKKCKIRVFILGDKETMKEDRKDMKMLLKRFRLEFEDIVIITDVDKAPLPKNMQRYEETIAPFKLSVEQTGGDVQELKRLSPWKFSDKDLEAIKPKVERTVRLNEIIKKNSIPAALVVISLPVPDVNCPSSLYMAWLEALSYGIHCPVLLIRGNQENVMTFYCQ